VRLGAVRLEHVVVAPLVEAAVRALGDDDAPRVSGTRRANRAYKINISPKKLRKGATYTVRMFARSADGKRTQSARLSAKRL
jgi:hypothetical protein